MSSWPGINIGVIHRHAVIRLPFETEIRMAQALQALFETLTSFVDMHLSILGVRVRVLGVDRRWKSCRREDMTACSSLLQVLLTETLKPEQSYRLGGSWCLMHQASWAAVGIPRKTDCWLVAYGSQVLSLVGLCLVVA